MAPSLLLAPLPRHRPQRLLPGLLPLPLLLPHRPRAPQRQRPPPPLPVRLLLLLLLPSRRPPPR